MAERGHLSIGEVLDLLVEEFPDVTISKIRFLESRGLIHLERTPSGYRRFYDEDVERLRWILRQQREHFLPLKIIKGRLERNGGGGPDGRESVTFAPSLFDGHPGAATPLDDLHLVGKDLVGEDLFGGGEGAVLVDVAASREGGASSTAGFEASPGAEQTGRTGGELPGRSPGAAAAELRPPRRRTDHGGAAKAARPTRRAAALRNGQSGVPEADPGRSHGELGDDGAILDVPGRGSGAYPGGRPGGVGSAGGDPAVAPAARAVGGPAGAGRTDLSRSGPVEPRAARPGPGPSASGGRDAQGPGGGGPAPGPDERRGGGGGQSAADPPAGAPLTTPGGEGAGTPPGVPQLPVGAPKGPRQPRFDADLTTGASLTADELAAAAGVGLEVVAELVEFGFIRERSIAGVAVFDEDALVLTRLAGGFRRFGIEARHLRTFKHAAEREAGLYAQIVTPLLRQRNPTSRERALTDLDELAELGNRLRDALVREELRDLTGG